MKTKLLFTAVLVFISLHSFAQGGWTISSIPMGVTGRIDDIFMVDVQTGYATGGEYILKTTDGGNNWFSVRHDTMQGRSIEFINAQKGFAGGLMYVTSNNFILFKTLDGGISWTDITTSLDVRARVGICGLAIPDSNTIYGCGNWWQDSAYIVKSIDGGNTWSYIDMSMYAASLIDMYFLNKDTGFATGRGLLPLETAVILYTIDGGQTWTYKFQNTEYHEYCWKIQHFTDQIYFASIEDAIMTNPNAPTKILKSTDGGMTWNMYTVISINHEIQGIGFIDSLRGWTGGWANTFESTDGGITWDSVNVCPGMNRVFKVNDTLLFASGLGSIWKYSTSSTGISHSVPEMMRNASIKCYPNPAYKNINVDLILLKSTRALVLLLDENGKRVKVIDNSNKAKGTYQYQLDTSKLPQGMYYVVLKTHEDMQTAKVVVSH